MKRIIIYIAMLGMLCSCVDEEQYSDSPRGNFEALWRIFDEHYCFFSYKKAEYGLDWARNWSWHEDYPQNYSDSLMRIYMGTDYKIAAGLEYRTLDDNIGFVRYSSFSNGIGEGNLDAVLSELATCNGLIIDIRNNSGGNLTNAEQLAARFTNKEILVGYMQHKTGRGHDDFSAMEEQRLKPSNGMRWQKPVVVLTNRTVFSAANEFVKYMKCCPNVTIARPSSGHHHGRLPRRERHHHRVRPHTF